MFDFIKRFKKNEPKRHDAPISTLSLNPEEYMSSVESELLPLWVDAEFMTKTGVKDMFNGCECVKNRHMTYEDAFDCLKRITRMVEMSTYVIEEFGARSESLRNVNGLVVNADNFYTANTIRDLLIEAGEKEYVYDDDIPETAGEAIGMIDDMLAIMDVVKTNMFVTIVMCAKASLQPMRGFV